MNSSELHIAFGYILKTLISPLKSKLPLLPISKNKRELKKLTKELYSYLKNNYKKNINLNKDNKKHVLHLLTEILKNISLLKKGNIWTSKLKRNIQEALIILYNYTHYNHLTDQIILKPKKSYFQINPEQVDKLLRQKIRGLYLKNKKTGKQSSLSEFENNLDTLIETTPLNLNLKKILLIIKKMKPTESCGLVFIWHDGSNPYGYVMFKIGDQGYVHANHLKAYPTFYNPEQFKYYLQKRKERVLGIESIAYSDKIKRKLYFIALTEWRWHPTTNNLYSVIQQAPITGQNQLSALWDTTHFVTNKHHLQDERKKAKLNRLARQKKLKEERKIHGFSGNCMVFAKWLSGLAITQNEFRPNLHRSRENIKRFIVDNTHLHLDKDALSIDIGDNMGDCGKYIKTSTIEENNEVEQKVRKGLIEAGIPQASANIYAAHTNKAEKLAMITFKALFKNKIAKEK